MKKPAFSDTLSPTRQPLLQPDYVEMGKSARLCVLGDLLWQDFSHQRSSEKVMAKQARGRGRYRYR